MCGFSVTTLVGLVREQAIEMLLDEIYNDVDAEYGIKVVLSPSGPTSRMNTLADLNAIREAGIPLSAKAVVNATDLPPAVKEEIIADAQQQLQAQQPQKFLFLMMIQKFFPKQLSTIIWI